MQINIRCNPYHKALKNKGIRQSMSRKGNCLDNSPMENFFGKKKNEMLYGRKWEDVSIEDFIRIVNEYIVWYNTERIKKSLNDMSPMEYRQSL